MIVVVQVTSAIAALIVCHEYYEITLRSHYIKVTIPNIILKTLNIYIIFVTSNKRSDSGGNLHHDNHAHPLLLYE